MGKLSMVSVGAASLSTSITAMAEIQPLATRSLGRSLSRIGRVVSGVALVSLSLSILASGRAEAGSFTFTKIVDTDTSVPGTTLDFTSLSTLPALDNGTVAFTGQTVIPDPLDPTVGTSVEGIYISTGGSLDVVADANTSIPGGTGRFQFFSNPSLDNGSVAFTSNTLPQVGVYTSSGGAINVVANTNTSIPSGTGNFTGFGNPSLNNGDVAFTAGLVSGSSLVAAGVYTNIGGTLNVVADTNTPVPGGTGNLFATFRTPSLDNGNVAFQGLENISPGIFGSLGIYTDIGGSLNVVADKNTPVPDGVGNFTQFEQLSLDDENVAFFGIDSSGLSGIYTSLGGTLDVVANTNTSVPGGTGNFSNFDEFSTSFDNGNVAFIGFDSSSQAGIYTEVGGVLREVIATGELLDGKSISSLNLGSEGLNGNQIAFQVIFDDGSQGIYVAKAVPEPSPALGTLAAGAFATSLMLKRRRKSRYS